MSYLFTTDTSIGNLTTGIDISATGVTIGIWVKVADHPADSSYIFSLGLDTELNDFISLNFDATADSYQTFVYDAAQTGANAKSPTTPSAGQYDGVWLPIVATHGTTDATRSIYVETYANDGNSPNTTSRVTSTLGQVRIGCAPNGGGAVTNCYIAEVAIWNTVLTQQQITDYLAGNAASTIGSPVAYYPLYDNDGTSIPNDGSDSGGDLTVTGAVHNADHPTINSGLPDTRIIVPTGPAIP